jgi:hypothetical protein
MTATLPPRSVREELERIDTKAACGSGRHEPDLWHSVVAEEIDRAKSICMTECRVMDGCRAWALATDQEHGVWGGLSKRDRDGMAKASPVAPSPPLPSRRSQTKRHPCRVCERPVGLDAIGRTYDHTDKRTDTTCSGSWTIPEEVKA